MEEKVRKQQREEERGLIPLPLELFPWGNHLQSIILSLPSGLTQQGTTNKPITDVACQEDPVRGNILLEQRQVNASSSACFLPNTALKRETDQPDWGSVSIKGSLTNLLAV